MSEHRIAAARDLVPRDGDAMAVQNVHAVLIRRLRLHVHHAVLDRDVCTI
eukprot:CAMPEP_0174297358 /NCGR_PEP_ID=MMETSP0809-20121228/50786_1 /TAXON_ID=73025 ORGANISM="Eutreptiella gymnastica-like, Strain CCMP1594" /NCGR_SAMPLE_ID=MMETSP0809 /ASSEMBLY_ACC=CAM_ASM_000658 /LENGTH=49 /DNA_ID= /DNA_START= /DNA_END= /DNA_ORIENTATION=